MFTAKIVGMLITEDTDQFTWKCSLFASPDADSSDSGEAVFVLPVSCLIHNETVEIILLCEINLVEYMNPSRLITNIDAFFRVLILSIASEENVVQ